MPRRILTRLQLEGELFLLTFPFIEPKRQAHSETVRNWPLPARGSPIPPYRPACAILLESQIPTNIAHFRGTPRTLYKPEGQRVRCRKFLPRLSIKTPTARTCGLCWML